MMNTPLNILTLLERAETYFPKKRLFPEQEAPFNVSLTNNSEKEQENLRMPWSNWA